MEDLKKLARLLFNYGEKKSELDYSQHMCYDHKSEAHCGMEPLKEEEKDWALQKLIDFAGPLTLKKDEE